MDNYRMPRIFKLSKNLESYQGNPYLFNNSDAKKKESEIEDFFNNLLNLINASKQDIDSIKQMLKNELFDLESRINKRLDSLEARIRELE